MKKDHCDISEKTAEVWREFHDRLLAFIRGKVRGKAVAEDILQDVFIKVHRNIDSVRKGEKLESWLYRITRNTIVDHYRTRQFHEELPDLSKLPAKEGSNTHPEEVSDCMASLISHLPEKYARAVRLCDVEGRPQQEVATLENISLSGAKSRIQRGRARLKQMLSECCGCMSRQQLLACSEEDSDCDLC